MISLDSGAKLSCRGRTAESMGTNILYPVVEVFAGVQNIARGDGFGFEYRKSKSHNVHCKAGLMILLVALAMTVPGGLVWIAPMCASWLAFVSVSTSKRLQDLLWVEIG